MERCACGVRRGRLWHEKTARDGDGAAEFGRSGERRRALLVLELGARLDEDEGGEGNG